MRVFISAAKTGLLWGCLLALAGCQASTSTVRKEVVANPSADVKPRKMVANPSTDVKPRKVVANPFADVKPRKVVANPSTDVKPLVVGARVPRGQILKTMKGATFNLNQAFKKKPTVLVFFRSGWCLDCSPYLRLIRMMGPELSRLGYQVLAITPDRPERLALRFLRLRRAYRPLSDSPMKVCKAFGIAYRVDDDTFKMYHKAGMNLELESGQTHHILPVESVYIIDTQGIVRFVINDPKRNTITAYILAMAARKIISAPRSR